MWVPSLRGSGTQTEMELELGTEVGTEVRLGKKVVLGWKW